MKDNKPVKRKSKKVLSQAIAMENYRYYYHERKSILARTDGPTEERPQVGEHGCTYGTAALLIQRMSQPVSYTHLTLPTIYSV